MSAALSALVALLVIGTPVAFALASGGLLYLLESGAPSSVMASYLFSALNSSSLMAIPFFVLAAEILSRCGATRDLIAFVMRITGGNRGSLPVVAVLSCTFFAAVSGSSTATAAAIGVVMIPELIRHGYDRRFAVGLIATAGGLGMLIPPSIPLILYGLVTDTSVRSLFEASMMPGVALAGLLCAVGYIVGRRMPIGSVDASASAIEGASPRRAIALLIMPVVVLGGIYTGAFTPTEASAVSAIYALAVAVVLYRLRPGAMVRILSGAAATASMILMIMGGAALLGYAVTSERIPHVAFEWVAGLGFGDLALLFALAACFLVAGMVLEVLSVILITMPILLPILLEMQVDLIAFAILLIINMELAVITPPIGLNLFAISSISGVRVHDVFIGTLPFAAALFAFLVCAILVVGVL